MEDTFDLSKERRKKTFRKIDRGFVNFETENMKTPQSNFNKQPVSSKFKSSHYSSGLDDQANTFQSPSFWEKRSNRRFHGDRGYGAKWRGGRWGLGEDGLKDDVGRPPGTTEGNKLESSAVITPVILTREKSSAEPTVTGTPAKASSSISSSVHSKENEPPKDDSAQPTIVASAPARQYQIASKPSVLEAVVLAEQNMSSPVKLLDDSLMLGEDLSPYLLDQNQFLVIAVVGLQGSGKSTIASFLADPHKGLELSATQPWVFRPESPDEVLRGCHTTSGVDAFITKDRVIILDVQPLLSPSVMDYVVAQERKASLDYSSSTENLLEVESLQLLTFAMSVAHVLVVVQDYILHPNIIRLLHTCQMMKPAQSTSSSQSSSSSRNGLNRSAYEGTEIQQYFPHLVFAHNRAFPQHFIPKAIEELQALYLSTLGESNFCFESQVGICSGIFSPPLTASAANSNIINLFLIPDVTVQDKCAVSFAECVKEMRRQVYSLSRCPLTHVALTEKSWYQYACRMWESVRKSNLYIEYSRLLP